MCPCCHRGKNLERKRERSEKEENKLKKVKRHKLLKDDQRSEYQKLIENLTEGNAVIVMDYKQNVKLKGASEELSNDYYNRPQRTVFNIAIFTSNKKLNHFTFLSADLTHTSFFAINAFKQVLEHPDFQKL